jgi:putative oligomerization/nucleic acid binding protein
MMRRRRPLARAAMIGGTAYVAHKAGQASAQNQMREQEQEERLQSLEQQQSAPPPQQYAPPPPQYAPPPAAAPAGGGSDVVSQLTELAKLRDAGVLTPEEFEAAKGKLLA